MGTTYKVAIDELIQAFELFNLTPDIDTSETEVTHPEINRPALQLTGFYDFFDADRLQILGLVEYSYLQGLPLEQREKTLSRLFEQKIPCLIVCRGLPVFPEMINFAVLNRVPLLRTDDTTTDFMGEVIKWLKVQLAPRLTMHGVLVDIFGEGVLITGESGIGKSETALELIKRGHRLVADDSVEIKKVSNQTLIGTCPDIIRYFIELRGIGVIDARSMFGVQSIKEVQNIDLVIKLEIWDDRMDYNRLGLEDEYIEILGNKVVCCKIPIRPGRNTAIICESAAVNHRLKKLGYNAAQVLSDKVMGNISRHSVAGE